MYKRHRDPPAREHHRAGEFHKFIPAIGASASRANASSAARHVQRQPGRPFGRVINAMSRQPARCIRSGGRAGSRHHLREIISNATSNSTTRLPRRLVPCQSMPQSPGSIGQAPRWLPPAGGPHAPRPLLASVCSSASRSRTRRHRECSASAAASCRSAARQPGSRRCRVAAKQPPSTRKPAPRHPARSDNASLAARQPLRQLPISGTRPCAASIFASASAATR